MFKVGERLTSQELASRMGYSYNTLRARREEILTNLRIYVRYDVIKSGRAILYEIKEVYDEYKSMGSKRSRQKTYSEIEGQLLSFIKENPVGTSISYSEKVNIDLSASTREEYSRRVKKDLVGNKVGDFGTHGRVSHKVWCFREREFGQSYEPMNQEEITIFLEMFKCSKDEFINILTDRENNELTKQEVDALVGDKLFYAYLEAQSLYKSKYGKTPTKVPYHKLNFELR